MIQLNKNMSRSVDLREAAVAYYEAYIDRDKKGIQSRKNNGKQLGQKEKGNR